MAPVPLKYIVFFSSQDEKNPAENLLNSNPMKKWLSRQSDHSGRLQVEIHLDKACVISHMDIGSYWVFSVHVEVGLSSWPQGTPYKTLLSNLPFMTPVASRTGKQKSCVKMLKQSDFDEDTCGQKWDRLRITCYQPYRKDVQFGLNLLQVFEQDSPQETKSAKKDVANGMDTTTPNKNKSVVSPTTPSAIRKHFFGNSDTKSCTEKDGIISRMFQLEGTSQTPNLSRSARLLLEASNKSPKYKTTKSPFIKTNVSSQNSTIADPSSNDPDCTLLSDGQNQKNYTSRAVKKKVSVEKEMDLFLAALNIKALDLDKITYADMRHQFEKQKCRKLSKEEKKVFFAKANDVISRTLTENSQDIKTDNDVRKSSSASPLTPHNKARRDDLMSRSNTPNSPSLPKCKAINAESRSPAVSKPNADDAPPPLKVQVISQEPRLKTTSRSNISNASPPPKVKVINAESRSPAESKPNAHDASPHLKVQVISQEPRLKTTSRSNICNASPPPKVKVITVESAPTKASSSVDNTCIRPTSSKKTSVCSLVSVCSHGESPVNQASVTAIQSCEQAFNVNSQNDIREVKVKSQPMKVIRPSQKVKQRSKHCFVSSDTCDSQQGNSMSPETGPAKLSAVSSSRFVGKQGKKQNVTDSNLVDSPLCQGKFSITEIEAHAASCGQYSGSDIVGGESQNLRLYWETQGTDDHPYSKSQSYSQKHELQGKLRMAGVNDGEDCPLCGEHFPRSMLNSHADRCAASVGWA